MTDRVTRLLLLIIAIGVWALALGPLFAPQQASAARARAVSLTYAQDRDTLYILLEDGSIERIRPQRVLKELY